MLMMTLILPSKTIFRGKEFDWRTLSRNMHEGIDLYVTVFQCIARGACCIVVLGFLQPSLYTGWCTGYMPNA